jgi:predicted phosphoribosyltransferase
VPVVQQSLVAALADEVDELVCLLTPDDGLALDAYYADFTLTTDDAVVELLRKAGSPVRKAGSPVRGAVPGRGLRPGVGAGRE